MYMSTAVHISLDEYLNTDYEPDCDYVDGVLEERNVGKNRHSRTQGLLTIWLGSREKEHGHKVLVEQRVQVSRSRMRIPDICLVDQLEITTKSLKTRPRFVLKFSRPKTVGIACRTG